MVDIREDGTGKSYDRRSRYGMRIRRCLLYNWRDFCVVRIVRGFDWFSERLGACPANWDRPERLPEGSMNPRLLSALLAGALGVLQ
jgi:hypothetical protein